MSDTETAKEREAEAGKPPYQVRLPGFGADRSIGLGDAVSGVTRALGLRSCGGCAQRAAALNRWVVFTR
jgi:hypothetical protein